MQRTLLLSRSREAQVIELARCARDPVYFVNHWAWTTDPRLPLPLLPFTLFPQQAACLRWLEEREQTQTDGLIEKSRDAGATWLACAYMMHRWLFYPGWHGAVGSRKLELVDKLDNPDCIFEKFRTILRALPAWMLPTGFSWRRDSGLGKLINRATDAAITGEGGDQIGRGGRSSMYFVDESAFLDHPEKVDAALSANTNVRIDISTPNGPGNPFAQKRLGGHVAVFTLHWKNDPRKNAWEMVDEHGRVARASAPDEPPPEPALGLRLRYPWYEKQKARLSNPVIVAQELDIDYTASIEGITIPAAWVRAAVNLHQRVKLPRHGQTIAALDVADGGANKSVYLARTGCIITSIAARSEGNTTDTTHWALAQCRQDGAGYLNFDSVGVGAGVAGTLATAARSGRLHLAHRGVNVGEKPTGARWPDGRTSAERFVNLKAELWWLVRTRFEKTYEFVEQGVQHPLDELISIPDHPELIAQLSMVLHYSTETGKIQIERKEELRKRGVASPDYADALMLLFAPTARPLQAAAGPERAEVRSYVPR